MSIDSYTRSTATTPVSDGPSAGWYWAAGLLLVAGLAVVGEGLTDDVLLPLFGAGLLLLLTTGGAIAIAVVTGIRRSRVHGL